MLRSNQKYKKREGSKLDELLKQGASNNKNGKKIDVDKAVTSTTDRLIKTTIQFTLSKQTIKNDELYTKAGYIVLDPSTTKNGPKRLTGSKQTTNKKKKKPVHE